MHYYIMNPSFSKTLFVPCSFFPISSSFTSSHSPFHTKCTPTPTPTIMMLGGGGSTESPHELERKLEALRAQQKRLAELLQLQQQMKAQQIQQGNTLAHHATKPYVAPLKDPERTPFHPASGSRPGKHSERSRFLSVVEIRHKEFLPRIVAIAGYLPTEEEELLHSQQQQLHDIPYVTKEKILTAPTFPRTELGTYRTTFGATQLQPPTLTHLPDLAHWDTVALEGNELLHNLSQPVAIMCTPELLNVSGCDPEIRGLLVIDKDLSKYTFEETKFYVYQNKAGKIEVGWYAEEPNFDRDGVTVLGFVAYYITVESLRNKKIQPMMAELSDEFQF